MVVPEIYAKNAGMTGNMQGAKKEPSPAIAATIIVMSAITEFVYFFIKVFFNF